MIDKLINVITPVVTITEADRAVFETYCKVKKIKRRQFFLQEGDVCKSAGFVASGCLKTYTIDKNGDEHVFQIAIEGWWVSDMYSHLTGEPATFNIEALEDCELITMDLDAREKIFNEVPSYERFHRILLEKNYVATQRRLNSMLSNTAEERYLAFIRKYPQIVMRVPQLVIASYLGIAPESLSRIRKTLAK